jgi:hypothetical protein
MNPQDAHEAALELLAQVPASRSDSAIKRALRLAWLRGYTAALEADRKLQREIGNLPESDTASDTPRQLSCGCCTGIAVDGDPMRLDQCVCMVHQDIPRGRPSRCCAFHRPSRSQGAVDHARD